MIEGRERRETRPSERHAAFNCNQQHTLQRLLKAPYSLTSHSHLSARGKFWMELVFASHSHLSALGDELGDTIQNAIAAPAINFSTANIDSFLTAFSVAPLASLA